MQIYNFQFLNRWDGRFCLNKSLVKPKIVLINISSFVHTGLHRVYLKLRQNIVRMKFLLGFPELRVWNLRQFLIVYMDLLLCFELWWRSAVISLIFTLYIYEKLSLRELLRSLIRIFLRGVLLYENLFVYSPKPGLQRCEIIILTQRRWLIGNLSGRNNLSRQVLRNDKVFFILEVGRLRFYVKLLLGPDEIILIPHLESCVQIWNLRVCDGNFGQLRENLLILLFYLELLEVLLVF